MGRLNSSSNPGQSRAHPEEKFLGIFHIPEIVHSIALAFFLTAGIMSLFLAFTVRTIAIKQFGTVIHEFDPWFNFRTAQYIQQNGWRKFLDWYDYQSWYPLGRPIGTTTYPGLQLTAVAMHSFLRFFGNEMSLNDVCCYIPAWFGSVSTILVGFLAYECSQSRTTALFAASIMAVIPSHIVRTVGGGFDNESVAIPAMCAVFYFWTRCLNQNQNYHHVLFGVLTGLSYGYMVLAWGGFIYVTNIIALHTVILLLWDWLRGRYCVQLYQSYSLYFVIGTAIATSVAPVGSMPFKSIEQISGLVVFMGMQVIQLSELHRQKKGIRQIWSRDCLAHRIKYILFSAIGGMSICFFLDYHGFFGPLTARVRSLIIQHTSTGNPLVDSVAEHQPMSVEGLWLYSSYAFYFTPLGAIIALASKQSRQTFFLFMNLVISWHFAMKMSRLIIFSSIPCAVFSGIFLGKILDNAWKYLIWPNPINLLSSKSRVSRKNIHWYTRIPPNKLPQICFSIFSLMTMYSMLSHANLFLDHCWDSARAHSQPQIVFHHYDRGQYVIIDDYRESYTWLREHTSSDSRVLAWWDYGYHITGIANRTSLCDGNTWNHEAIALVGRLLCTPIDESHGIIRHLADYVLLWTGGGADDLAKSPWIARISNSVFHDICPNDPLCAGFRFLADGSPSPLMEKSTLYTLQKHGDVKNNSPLAGLFEKVHSSRNSLVSIYKVLNVSQESKEWVKRNVQEKQARRTGCRQGTYPPAKELQAVLQRGNPMGN